MKYLLATLFLNGVASSHTTPLSQLAVETTQSLQTLESTPSEFLALHDSSKADPSIEVIDIYVRENPTFIEGLFFDDDTGRLLESSGWEGESQVLWTKIDNASKQIKVAKSMLLKGIFGEGVCPINDDELMWLTWRDRDVYVLDAKTLDVLEERTFPLWPEAVEGWGVALDKENSKIYLSDGTDVIHKIDQESLEMEECIHVRYQNG